MTRPILDIPRELIIEKIQEARGNLSVAAKMIGIGRATIYRRIEGDEEILELINEARLKVGEEIENVLINKALNGEIAAVIFYLKSQMGWKENSKLEIEGSLITKSKERDKREDAAYLLEVLNEFKTLEAESRGSVKVITSESAE